MPKTIEMLGQKFNRLTVKGFAGFNKHKEAIWDCICECGNLSVVTGSGLRKSKSKSCGCWRKEQIGGVKRKHGASSALSNNRAAFSIWVGMRSRCNNPRAPFYKRYGGAGVKVCPEWDDFSVFLRDMGSCEKGMTLDRIDPSRDYSADNCRWATPQQQATNRRTPSSNTSGVKNVKRKAGKWVVVVQSFGRRHHFGAHDDIELAELIAYEARRRLHGDFANHQ